MTRPTKARIDDIQVVGQKWGSDFIEEIEDLHSLLEPFGISVYEDPSSDGSDEYGIVLSEESLTDEQLEEASRKLFPENYDEDADADSDDELSPLSGVDGWGDEDDD